MTYSEIRQAVMAGAFDDDLNQIAADVRAREATLAAKTARTLKPGDIITVSNLRPAYINGQQATIIQVNRTRAVVKFNDSARARRFADQEVTVPLMNITLVDGSATTAPAAPPAPSNQRMREGAPVQVPSFGPGIDGIKAQDKWYENYRKDKQIISFPVADNYANYEVRGNVLHHIPVFDAYRAHPALLRGITKAEVDAMLESERKMAELFSRAN